MYFIIAAAGIYGNILLDIDISRKSKMDLVAGVFCLIFGIFACIRQSGIISRYKGKKQRATKRISAVITKRERIRIKARSSRPVYRYLYTFTGLDEYEGVSFCDETLLLENVHVEGEKVSFLINPENPEEFWFEEEDEPGKGLIVCSVIIILGALMNIGLTIMVWERLPSGLETRFVIIAFVIGLIILLIVCVRATIKAYQYKNMKRRMTKRINVVIANRWAPGQYSDDGLSEHRYRYIFKGRDEYDGVTFEGSSLRIKKKHEEGEIVSLLVNEYNLEEFWFEEADEPGKLASGLWIIFVLLVFSFLPVLSWIIMGEWDVLPWF